MEHFMRSLIVLFGVLAAPACGVAPGYQPENGDIVFHTSRSAQSLAVQKATASPYSHMGILYVREGKPFVFEAAERVKLTPFDEWVRRGGGGHFVAKRLIDADRLLTPEALARMLEAGKELEGKHYDLYFEWSDDRVYCSELVWKIFKRALAIEVGKLQPVREFDLSDPAVQAKIRERWKGGAPPPGEPVVSPAAIFSSDKLKTVYQSQ